MNWRIGQTTDKQRVVQAIEQLPEDATVEDAIERLCFIAMVKKGLEELDGGRAISHDEARRRIVGD